MAVFVLLSPVYKRVCMKKTPLMRALWTCVEAEAGLEDLFAKLTDLQKQLTEELDPLLIDVLDEFHAAQNRLRAVKHDLIICVRTTKEKK